jgi:hypothetical protein
MIWGFSNGTWMDHIMFTGIAKVMQGHCSHEDKVELNTQSLTETELVGADMYMPEMLWMLYFIQSRGYDVETIHLYQDNKSTQLLMKNEQFSSGKKTKHIRVKFFFIKDRIDSGYIRVVHCPTEEMWADVLTKPLQGKAFRVMQSKLMNCSEEYTDSETNDENSTQAKDAEKRCKASPVAGRMSLRAPTQTLQECVKRLQFLAAIRSALGVARILRRLGNVNKNCVSTRRQ